MPLFFLLSGYTKYALAGKPEIPFKVYVKKLFLSMMIPDYCFELLNGILWCGQQLLHGQPLPTAEGWRSIFLLADLGEYGGMGNKFWFLPCMFVSSILFYWILHFTKKRESQVGVILALLLLSWGTGRVLPSRLPLQLDVAMMATAFMVIGYLGGEFLRECLENRNWLSDVVLIALSVFFVWFSHQKGAYLRMFENQFGNYPYVLLAALFGAFAFVLICKYLFLLLQRLPAADLFVRWCGINSMGVYLVHLEVLAVIRALCPNLPWFGWFLLTILFTVPAVNYISAYLPICFGKIKK